MLGDLEFVNFKVWLNLVYEAEWFGFLEAHGAWNFLFAWFNQLRKRHGTILYALGKRDFSLTKSPFF